MVSVPATSVVQDLLLDSGSDLKHLLSQSSVGSSSSWMSGYDHKLQQVLSPPHASLSSASSLPFTSSATLDTPSILGQTLASTLGGAANLGSGDAMRGVSSPEPSNAALYAAMQSIQLKLQVHEQAAEFQQLEKQNMQLLQALLIAQQQIQELQAEVGMLHQAVEKADNSARYAREQGMMREVALQQRNAQLTASNLEAEMTIRKMEESLKEAKARYKDLNYSNIMLSLGYPPTSAGGGKSAGAGGPRGGNSSYANRKCYNCGQKGHKACDCPNPRTRPDASSGSSSPRSPPQSEACSPPKGTRASPPKGGRASPPHSKASHSTFSKPADMTAVAAAVPAPPPAAAVPSTKPATSGGTQPAGSGTGGGKAAADPAVLLPPLPPQGGLVPSNARAGQGQPGKDHSPSRRSLQQGQLPEAAQAGGAVMMPSKGGLAAGFTSQAQAVPAGADPVAVAVPAVLSVPPTAPKTPEKLSAKEATVLVLQ